jgi:hypothetical protein
LILKVNPATGAAPRLMLIVDAGLDPHELSAVTDKTPGVLSKVKEIEFVVLMPNHVAGKVQL